MAKRARSARGEVVDFDLISIKSQLADAPKTVEVSSRREYIDTKEGGNKKRRTVATQPVATTQTTSEFDNANDAEPIPESVAKAAAQTTETSGDDFLIPVVQDDDDIAAIEASVNQPTAKTKRTPRKAATKKS